MKNRIVEEMAAEHNIHLPGGDHQFKHLLSEHNSPQGKTLILGTIEKQIISKMINTFSQLNIIVDNYDSLMELRFSIKENDSVKVRMMDFSNTDFETDSFDLIYAQGSISVPERKSILKEIKRILSPGGICSVGEIVSLKNPAAKFVIDIWEQSGLEPLQSAAIKSNYESRGFEVISEKDLSDSLRDYYEKSRNIISKTGREEKELNKKYFSRMKHESNAYLKLGGDKYIGFKSLVMRKLN